MPKCELLGENVSSGGTRLEIFLNVFTEFSEFSDKNMSFSKGFEPLPALV